ncbi:MAG: ABC transporter permease subunit [Candidatus Eisenbacteria bacterium]|nr:ABC transporter permease subunit [Candidatus Eisenbacteria bacterium]
MSSPRLRRLQDRTARSVITLGGLGIITSILGILVFIGGEALPLATPPSVSEESAARGRADANGSPTTNGRAAGAAVVDPGAATVVGWNGYRELLLRVEAAGRASVRRLPEQTDLLTTQIPALEGRTIVASALLDDIGLDWAVATDDGEIGRIRLEEGDHFGEQGRAYDPSVRYDSLAITSIRTPRVLAGMVDAEQLRIGISTGADSIALVHAEETSNLFGETRRSVSSSSLPIPSNVTVTALAFEGSGDRLYLGTEQGELLEYDLRAPGAEPSRNQLFATGVSALAMLNGGHSLIAGGRAGEVEIWFHSRKSVNAAPELARAHVFTPHENAIRGISVSRRDRGFLTWDAGGEARLHFATSGRTLLRMRVGESAPERVLLAAKADGILAQDGAGTIRTYALHNPHPELSAGALFGKIQYEGASEPLYVWQSTGSTDDYESKLSLVPLIFGTLKGTAYALLFSVPLAILAATYTSLFLHARLRSVIKPTMEMMAALPSVVLGFLAGLWLAPNLQRALPALLVLPIALVLLVIAAGWIWRSLPRQFTGRLIPGVESLFLIVVLAIGIRTVFALNPGMNALFPGGFEDWLYQSMGVRYDQRNALVIGVSMGIAVIPIVFTISEDSISNVPRALWAGSLALGASPWQTALRVILPAASPGIFSAVMIGLGRAVGETMIVLMATGNTPIIDWSAFNGFRTLAANIAVEIPEAPQGGTLYRLLFLTALLLFLMTFVVNTVAEVVRQRLRQRYSRF